MLPPPPTSTLFPYTTLFRSSSHDFRTISPLAATPLTSHDHHARRRGPASPDRKSTRLNSSHRCISYAVFCLKKKNITEACDTQNTVHDCYQYTTSFIRFLH